MDKYDFTITEQPSRTWFTNITVTHTETGISETAKSGTDAQSRRETEKKLMQCVGARVKKMRSQK